MVVVGYAGLWFCSSFFGSSFIERFSASVRLDIERAGK